MLYLPGKISLYKHPSRVSSCYLEKKKKKSPKIVFWLNITVLGLCPADIQKPEQDLTCVEERHYSCYNICSCTVSPRTERGSKLPNNSEAEIPIGTHMRAGAPLQTADVLYSKFQLKNSPS